MRIRRTYWLMATVLLATACTPTLVNFTPRVHVVQSGETLFSIAWRYQLDVRELVLWNDLANPDLILVGQRLFLTPGGLTGAEAVSPDPGPATPSASSGRSDTAQAESRSPGPAQSPEEAASTASAGSAAGSPASPGTPREGAAGPVATPGPTSAPAPVPAGSTGAAAANSERAMASRPPPAPPAPPPSLAVLPAPTWQWPVRGRVVSPYGAAQGTGSGIGISGQLGADIRASADGQVVYAGDGLAAYGNLIIIKHNDTFLSAYGHNDVLVVGEGDQVEQGDVIARMGMGPERQPQVHFEIRRNGTPVDPLGHLPN